MSEGDQAAPLRILLVDDQPVTQKLVSLLLEKWGHQVQVADDGRAAVTRFMQQKFDLVLMDLQMPVMDGLTATQTLREYEARLELAHTPIVAMTAQTSDTDRELCLRVGMDDFLPKPVTASAMQRLLLKYQRAAGSSGHRPPDKKNE